YGAGGPEVERKRANGEERQPIQQVERSVEAGDHPHLVVDSVEEPTHALTGIGSLTPGVGEQLYGLNVGIAVDHAASHDRSRVRLSLGDLAETRDVIAKKHKVTGQPEDER